MNRHILSLFLSLLVTVGTQAQKLREGEHSSGMKRISQEYNNVSLSDALSQLAEQQTDYAIMFLYNELEDFRITTTVNRKTLPDAIQQMIGFYPIRMTIDDSNPEGKKIFVECTHKTDRHLTGTIVDEQGLPVAYANIAVLHPADSTLLSGGVSNESGYFAIPYDIPPVGGAWEGAVLARISYIGYKTIYKQCTTEDMGTIRLQPEVYTINGVQVKGERLIVKAENGQSLVAKGENILNANISTRSTIGNQDYAMRIWMPYTNYSLTAIYRIGNFKEKKKKEVDTSRMGY